MIRLSSRIIVHMLALTGTILVVSPRVALAAPPKAEATSAPTPVAVPAPAPAPAEPEVCVPACRAGFVCARGQCVSRCNPPCANNEVCTADGQCIVPAQASPAAPPGAGQYPAPATSGPVAPNFQAQSTPQNTFETNADGVGGSESKPAHARLGSGFQVLLSAERLFGYAHTWTDLTPTQYQGSSISGVERSGTGDTLAFLGNSGDASLDPKLGVDFSVGGGVTVGGTLLYGYHASESTLEDSRQGASSTERKSKGPRSSTFGVGARVGYLVMFNDVVGIWPRAGLSYSTATTTTYSSTGTSSVETEVNANSVSVDPDVMLVVSPVPHFAFLFGVGGTVAVTGGYTVKTAGSTEEEGDASGGAIGIAAGLLGYL